MACVHEFGIIENLDENKDYAEFAEQVPPLLVTISKAKENNKFLIHFGI